MKLSRTCTNYLRLYAEPEVNLIDHGFSQLTQSMLFTQIIVVPAYQEQATFVSRFALSALAQQQVLMIVVINQPDDVPLESASAKMQPKLHQQLLACGHVWWQQETLTLVKLCNCDSALLVVDRFSQAIPAAQGVGLARKIGADLGLALINQGVVQTQIIACTDADATLPDDYFDYFSQITANETALVYNFHHCGDDLAIAQANALYELALRYYVAGLKYAGSSYAFFTIGSIIAFQVEAYAQVRGFPKRSAGEDFYFLNKLAKLGNIHLITDCVVNIEARTSARVPFGTGPAVAQILAQQQAGLDYCYYHPRLFELLKQVLHRFVELYLYKQQLDIWFETLPAISVTALKSIGLVRFVEQHQQVGAVQFNKQLQVWFDAFKTLKFLHAVRAQGYADLPLSQAITMANFSVAAH